MATLTDSFASKDGSLSLRDRLAAAVAQDKSEFFTWAKDTSGFLYVRYEKSMDDVWNHLRDQGYVESFNDPDWTKKFNFLHAQDLSWMDSADKDTVARFAFTLLRRERFVEGIWASAVESGMLLKLIDRADALGPRPCDSEIAAPSPRCE